MAESIKNVIKRDLDEFKNADKNKLVEKRYEKFRKMGVFKETASE